MQTDATTPNIIAPTMLRVVASVLQWCANGRNNSQQHATTCDRVCKRTQHVMSNNVGSCWPTMLRPFARGLMIHFNISKGNRTEWNPIWSVIIRVINKIGRPRSGSPICLITSMITDRIGRHEVLLPINHDFNKICDILGSFF